MSAIVIWHNPRCSKSRATLARIEAAGHTPEVVRYLETPPTVAELEGVLARLGFSPRDLIRTKEPAYAELELADPNKTRDALLEAMVAHPELIERPVVIRGQEAALGRPPENVDVLL